METKSVKSQPKSVKRNYSSGGSVKKKRFWSTDVESKHQELEVPSKGKKLRNGGFILKWVPKTESSGAAPSSMHISRASDRTIKKKSRGGNCLQQLAHLKHGVTQR